MNIAGSFAKGKWCHWRTVQCFSKAVNFCRRMKERTMAAGAKRNIDHFSVQAVSTDLNVAWIQSHIKTIKKNYKSKRWINWRKRKKTNSPQPSQCWPFMTAVWVQMICCEFWMSMGKMPHAIILFIDIYGGIDDWSCDLWRAAFSYKCYSLCIGRNNCRTN